MRIFVENDDGTKKDVTDAILSATQPREPAQESANRSTITTADRADGFYQNLDAQAKANQSLRDKLDNTFASLVDSLSKNMILESSSMEESRDRRRGANGAFDRALDAIVLSRTERDYSDAEDDENRRQNIDAAMARQTNLSAFNIDDIVTAVLARLAEAKQNG